MTRTIGLAIAVVVVAGFGFYVYSRKSAGLSIFGGPPLYSGYGPGAQNPSGPPAGRASFTSTLQDVNNVIQGGTDIIMSGKKAWGEIKDIFDNEGGSSDIDVDYVNSLPV